MGGKVGMFLRKKGQPKAFLNFLCIFNRLRLGLWIDDFGLDNMWPQNTLQVRDWPREAGVWPREDGESRGGRGHADRPRGRPQPPRCLHLVYAATLLQSKTCGIQVRHIYFWCLITLLVLIEIWKSTYRKCYRGEYSDVFENIDLIYTKCQRD